MAKTYAGSITLGTGQFCTNPGLILGIKGANLSNFIQVLSTEIVKLEPSCMLHPTIIGNYERNKQTALQQDGLTVKADFNDSVAVNHARQTDSNSRRRNFFRKYHLTSRSLWPLFNGGRM